MGRPNRDEVVSFLRQFKRAALEPPERLEIWSAIKNVDGMLQLGINAVMRDEYLILLTPEDYCLSFHPAERPLDYPFRK